MVSPTSGAVYYVAFCSLGFLNRTLVLPQVAKGRMGSCSAYPFKLYYSSDVLDQLGVPTITHAQFQIWAWRRSPSARMKDTVKPRMEKSPTASVPEILVFNYKL
ncbi:hypothetical protein PPACK8108_LOCUS12652 [Phakopsora pachyrhizi]|uniref:Uncharacterized protein n=1 Tax=Phakopsora pachyrhizi TaxID=170000 RepID=A0AAV0B222_PHAPC|nr:hypothetical protein PPACK8108_LOCUS12652 [Phakopsora pachyrhizi]